jgi:hypothetical protein
VPQWYDRFCDGLIVAPSLGFDAGAGGSDEDEPLQLLLMVIRAADFMELRPLLELTCAKLATLVRGLSPEEMAHCMLVGVDVGDGAGEVGAPSRCHQGYLPFTAKEEYAVQLQHPWCRDA